MENNNTYSILSKGGIGEFQIMNAPGNFLTVFSYRNWFSSNGSAPTPNGLIEIRSKDHWQTHFNILRDGHEIGDILFNWKGNIVITLESKMKGPEKFLLTDTGKHSDWTVNNEQDQVILIMHSDTHWSKVSYRFDVTVKIHPGVDILELLIACGYGTNLNMSMISGLRV
jgi:hypothetical protein